ncbi:MAG: class I SAM-dependent methyltransferase [Flavobacteriales bacterium]
MPVNYSYHPVGACNMCGASPEGFQTLGKRLDRSQGARPWKLYGQTSTIKQCRSCDLIFVDPQPVPASIQDHYGTPPESYWRPEYFEVQETYFASEIDWYKRLTDFSAGQHALDIGAGVGKCMIALEHAGFDTWGCEPSEPFHARAIERMGLSPDRLQCAAVENAEYPEAHFDFITFSVVLEHLYDPAACIERALKWLKPGGLIHIEVPSAHWLTHTLINRYYKLMGSDFVANLSPMHVPYHLHEFAPASFEAHGKRAGYTVADTGYYVCDTYLPRALDGVLKPYMRRTDKGMQLVVWLRKQAVASIS